MAKLIALIKDLAEGCYYGKIVITFENGKPVNCIKEESIKLR
jgi:hypothetical protein